MRTHSLVVGVVFAAVAARGELANKSFEEPAKAGHSACLEPAGWVVTGPWMRRETGWRPRHWGPAMMGYHHWRVADRKASGFRQDVTEIPSGAACEFTIHVSRDGDGEDVRQVEIRLEPLGGGKPLAAQAIQPRTLKPDEWVVMKAAGKNGPRPGIRVVVEVTPSDRLPRKGAIRFDDASLQVAGGGGAR